MAYAAIISLANTIDRSLNHNQIYISPAEKQLILSILEYVTSFQAFLENFPDKSNSLEGRMRELAYEAEDIIEYLMLEQVSLCSDRQTEECIQQLNRVYGKIDKIPKLKEIKDRYISTDGERGADSSAREDAMFGFEDHVTGLKERLCREPSKLQVIPIYGMGGIGKTTLAKNVYDDPLIIENFVIRVWVTISHDYSAQRILSSLLECLKEFNTDGLEGSNDEKVHEILMGRRYLVVIDDIWSRKAWDVVRMVFPDDVNGSRIMLTTRLSYVASYPDPSSKLYKMSFLNTDQSWDLLKQKLFADEDCPSELEDIGKEIARSCKG